jgi:hypothetical protein
LLGQDLGLRQGRDRHFSWPRPSPRISLCQGRHSVSRLDGLHKSTRVWRVAAQATQAGRGCSPPSVRKMPERARFLSPVTGSALRALREHRLRTDKFRPSSSAAWSKRGIRFSRILSRTRPSERGQAEMPACASPTRRDAGTSGETALRRRYDDPPGSVLDAAASTRWCRPVDFGSWLCVHGSPEAEGFPD